MSHLRSRLSRSLSVFWREHPSGPSAARSAAEPLTPGDPGCCTGALVSVLEQLAAGLPAGGVGTEILARVRPVCEPP